MNAETIARNSMWYGLETGISLVLTLFTSIAVARSVGPAHLGYFIFVWWLINLAGSVGSLGIPTTTKKYMSEYFGRGEHGEVRTIFHATLRLQGSIALGITAVAVLAVMTTGDPQYRMVSLLMALSVLPYMLNAVAAHANAALEDLQTNVPASLLATGIYVSAVFLSIAFGWGLVGIAAGLLTMRTAELFVRIVPLWRRLSRYPSAELPAAIKSNMRRFASQSLLLMTLGLVVWDRSELFFLKTFCSDIRQVAFYSVAFNVTERLLVLSQIFGTATGTTVMVQYGRDERRLGPMVAAATRYLGLIAFPVHLGLAAIAGPITLLAYGSQYAPAILPLALAAVFGIPKAFMVPVTAMLQSYDRQALLIRWGLIAGVVNLTLDLLLIPKYGANGAAIANGGAQTFSAVALWMVAARMFKLELPWKFLAGAAACATIMGVSVHFLVRTLPILPAVSVGIFSGAVLYLILLRLGTMLDGQDYQRLSRLRNHVPAVFRSWFDAGLGFLVPIAGRVAAG